MVINAGFQGCYSLDTYYLYLKERGLKLNPDIIVIGLFIGNDIEHPLSDENIWTKVDSNGFPIRIINKYSTHNFYKDFFFNYSFFRSSNLVKLIFHTSDKIVRKILIGDKEEEWINNSNDFINIYRDKYLMKTEKRFDDAEKMILAISDVAKQNNSEIIFLLIPELLQIDSSKIPRIIINNEKLDREKPQQILREFFIENNLNYIDLLHELIQYNAEDLYYSDDRHWNKQGHEVASKVIYNYIVENNFQLDSEYEK